MESFDRTRWDRNIEDVVVFAKKRPDVPSVLKVTSFGLLCERWDASSCLGAGRGTFCTTQSVTLPAVNHFNRAPDVDTGLSKLEFDRSYCCVSNPYVYGLSQV